jgi:arsenite methyltransferase
VATQDRWARWVLQRSHGGDPKQREEAARFLAPIRDAVVQNARIGEGDVVLDVGTGDGLIAFAAVPLAGADGKVIFSDVSSSLLDHCRQRAREQGVDTRCEFLVASADDLSSLPDGSVDVVTTRSVLIYVRNKGRAFHEFSRVLRPGGRLSIFEPINRYFEACEDGERFWNYDTTPVADLARKVDAVYRRAQPRGSDPMLDFDERDLLSHARSKRSTCACRWTWSPAPGSARGRRS